MPIDGLTLQRLIGVALAVLLWSVYAYLRGRPKKPAAAPAGDPSAA